MQPIGLAAVGRLRHGQDHGNEVGMTEAFSDRLAEAVRRRRTPAIVGIDPHVDLLPPAGIGSERSGDPAERIRQFCCEALDVVAPLVPAVKIQWAFFEQLGPSGMRALRDVVHHARRAGLLVIGDAKRGDIGTTARAYAQAFLGSDSPWGCDAMTVNPYLGEDAVAPFFERAIQTGTGVFVLVKTSNPGSGLLQDRPAPAQPLSYIVADLVERWARSTRGNSGYGAIGGVVGATHPQQLQVLRQRMNSAWLLVPGYGAQGATAHDVAHALDGRGLGALVNSSRGILFAWKQQDLHKQYGPQRWHEATEAALRAMIDQLRAHTPAGHL